MSRLLRSRRRRGRVWDRLNTSGVCFYCGLAADCLDHAWPVASNRPPPPGMNLLVESCTECNAIAHDRLFDSLQSRQAYIQDHLAQKYRRRITNQQWTAEDLAELGPRLRQAVEAGLRWEQSTTGRITYRHEGAVLVRARPYAPGPRRGGNP